MTKTYPANGRVKLYTLLADNPSTKSLKSGAVKSDLIEFEFADYAKANLGFKPMVREAAFDWGELAIVAFLQAKEFGKPLVLLPAPISGRLQHHCIVYNSEFTSLKPTELAGKRIGVRAYTQTTGAWIRGILQNEYGMDPSTVEWVTFEEPHVAEAVEPPNVVRAEKGKKLQQMLLDGELDAVLVGDSSAPDDNRIKTVIPDPKQAGLEWYARTKAMPMNHMAVVHADLSRQRPDVVKELYRLLLESRDLDTKLVNGLQTRPFGVEALRPQLELIIEYALQQKLLTRKLTVEELFDDTTRTLG